MCLEAAGIPAAVQSGCQDIYRDGGGHQILGGDRSGLVWSREHYIYWHNTQNLYIYIGIHDHVMLVHNRWNVKIELAF